MPIETQWPTHESASVSAAMLDAIPKFDQSGRAHSGVWLPVEHAVQSLTVSRDAGCMQYALLEIVRDFVLFSAATPSFEARVSARQFPMLVDEVCVELAIEQKSAIPDPRRAQLAARLSAAFEADPLEDGMDHPAEEIIGVALHSVRSELVLDWFEEFAMDKARPSFAASVLRCLGRQACPGTASWRAKLIRGALALDDVEGRDAAVQAAELWGDREVVDVLRSHREPEPWLRGYIRDVTDDLCE